MCIHMKKMMKNILSLKKNKDASEHLSEKLFSICGFCGCRFCFLTKNIEIYKQTYQDYFLCTFCLRNKCHLKENQIFLFSFCKIFELVMVNNKKDMKVILKNLYIVGNSFPFLTYNSECDFWAIDIDHEVLCDKKLLKIKNAISDLFDVFKVLISNLFLVLKYTKKELLEEIEIFEKTKIKKYKMFKGKKLI